MIPSPINRYDSARQGSAVPVRYRGRRLQESEDRLLEQRVRLQHAAYQGHGHAGKLVVWSICNVMLLSCVL